MVLGPLYVVIDGGLGSLLRYDVSGVIQKQSSSLFSYGTLAFNIIGAAFIGFMWELFQSFTK